MCIFNQLNLTLSFSVADDAEETIEIKGAKANVVSTISQYICSNSTVYGRAETSQIYHSKDRETPATLYEALKLHSHGRMTGTIYYRHSLGTSISIHRTMEIRKNEAKAVCKRWKQDGVVYPVNIKQGIFVVGGTDNHDISGRVEFHGTASSLTASPTLESPGTDPPDLTYELDGDDKIEIPIEFTNVPHIDDFAGDYQLSSLPEHLRGELMKTEGLDRQTIPEQSWLTHVCKIMNNDNKELELIPITYSGYFSYLQSKNTIRPPASVGVFPTLPDKAHTLAMQTHQMRSIKKATAHVNPGQTHVCVTDLLLIVQHKKAQKLFSDDVGEDKFVCMLGMLHTEMVLQECGGQLMGGSGWENMFHMAGIFPPGVSNSLLGGSHIKRTRHAYMLTVAWIHILEQRSYQDYLQRSIAPYEPFEIWKKRLLKNSPTFKYWTTCKNFLLLACRFIRGQRSGNWNLTINSLKLICRWCFVFGRTNYARWLPVFLRDMLLLESRHPLVFKAFNHGLFVIQRSNTNLSMMALDRNHEHCIKFLKEEGGPTGLYGDEEEKDVIEISRPGILRAVKAFEDQLQVKASDEILEHPESSKAEQQKFVTQLTALLQLVEDEKVINPMREQSPHLLKIDTGEIMDTEVTNCTAMLEDNGETLMREYVEVRVEKAEVPVSDVVSRPGMYTFNNRPSVKPSKGNPANQGLKLVTQMFMSLQARPEADMLDFFSHENQREPPNISDNGKLNQGSKSNLLDHLPGIPKAGKNKAADDATALLLDMPAVIHMVPPRRAQKFSEYTAMHLLPFIENQKSGKCTRVDGIWDVYDDNSIKNQIRIIRGGTSQRRNRVTGSLPIPKGKEWQKFLKDSDSKTDLFSYVSEDLKKLTSEKPYLVLTTQNEYVLSSQDDINLESLQPSTHKEADTRIFLHLKNCVENGHKIVKIRTVDTDGLVLALSIFHKIPGLEKLWIGFGSGKTYRDIPVHSVSDILGRHRCEALPVFHALTGCDFTSFFRGVRKGTFWKVWEKMPNLTQTFLDMKNNPEKVTIESTAMKKIESFMVAAFSKNCLSTDVNEARMKMFTTGLKSLEAIPPTKHALHQHIKRTLLVSAFTWKALMEKAPTTPDPKEWGWVWNDRLSCWMPHWTDLPDVSKGCSLLVHCGCKTACKGRCKCYKMGVKCSVLCGCEGTCMNNDRFN